MLSRIAAYSLFTGIFLAGMFPSIFRGEVLAESGSITVILTVAGKIQLEDEWTEGPETVNEWAKPLYRIWFDMNGNPSDGGYGNALGPKQAELRLDTGTLCFMWFGPDMQHNTGDDVVYCPLKRTGKISWKDKGIEASITDDGKSLRASMPLAKLGNPGSMEISFMVSPWMSSASDNLGHGANERPAWIVVQDAKKPGKYEQRDALADNFWPHLVPDRRANFDLVKTEVIIY